LADNPYAPPKAALGEQEIDRREKPRPVKTAVVLVYGSVAVGLLAAAFDPTFAAATRAVWFFLAFIAAAFGVTVLLAFLMGRGHNWARIVYSVLTILGTAMMLYFWEADEEWYLQAANLIQTAMQLAAIYLVFTRAAADWYRRTGPD
jgi:hypothetical protein